MGFHPRPIGPTAQSDAAPFSPEMVAGSRPPERRRGELALHRGGVTIGETQTIVGVPFSIEMTFATRPPEQLRSQPARFRDGGSVTPVTQDAAPFVPPMVQGSAPPERLRGEVARLRGGWWAGETLTILSTPFSIEMTYADRPDRPRPHKPTRGPYFFPFSGTPAPDSVDMWLGSLPAQSRQAPVHRDGLQVGTIEILAFSSEMVIGSKPDRQRYTAPFHQGSSFWPPDVDVFSSEMVIGSRPDRPRILLGARIPQPVSETTPISAPFSLEMVIGSRPDRQRYVVPVALRQGSSIMMIEVIQAAIQAILGDLTTLWCEVQPVIHAADAVGGSASDDTTLMRHDIDAHGQGFDGETDLNTALQKYFDTDF